MVPVRGLLLAQKPNQAMQIRAAKIANVGWDMRMHACILFEAGKITPRQHTPIMSAIKNEVRYV